MPNRIDVPGVKVDQGNGKLARVVVSTDQADAQVYLHGAHVTHYAPRGKTPVLFLSKQSAFEAGKPIRGGVPICFPWFGPHKSDPNLPLHGFVRLFEWKLDSVQKNSNSVEIMLSFETGEHTRKWTSDDFRLRHIITIGSTLTMALEATNTSQKPIEFSEALHTYFAISDIRNVTLEGLAGVNFHTKVKGQQSGVQPAAPMRFASETDNVYHETAATCTIHDGARRVINRKENSNTTVVWNPWIDRAKAMADMHDDEWQQFLCVETANAFESSIKLAPGATHTMRAIISEEGS